MKKFYLLFTFITFSYFLLAQNVGIGTATPNASAQLDVSSNNKGILFPRVNTSERNAIVNPATGLMVFDVEKNVPYYFNGVRWMPLGPIEPKDVQPIEFWGNSTISNGFGRTVAISGSYAAVGIPDYDTLGSGQIGAVLIYKKTNSIWAPKQLILAPDTATSDYFGYSMDMQGDYLVIGSPYKSVLATINSGKAYVYKLNTGTSNFDLDAQLTHPSGLLASSYFGYSVSVTSRSPVTGGVTVAVGSPGYTVGGTIKGTVSFFRRVAANNYTPLNTINGIQTNEAFGSAVDIDSNLVIIGAPDYDTTTPAPTTYNAAGRVQINRYNAGNYAAFDKSFTPNLDTTAGYGYSVAVDSASFVVAPRVSSINVNTSVKNYLRNNVGSYTNYNSYDLFNQNEVDVPGIVPITSGCQVAVSNSCSLIGVPHATLTPLSISTQFGRIEYLVINKKTNDAGGSYYNSYSQLFPPGKVKSTGFGWDVAVYKNDYIISAPNIINANGSVGAVYFGSIVE